MAVRGPHEVPCLQCKRPFTPSEHFMGYCSVECKQAARRRVCQWPPCGKTFLARNGRAKRRFCSNQCRQAAIGIKAIEAAAARAAARRVSVQCALAGTTCPRPNDLLLLSPSVARALKFPHHPECDPTPLRKAFVRESIQARRPRKGKEIFCEDCGTSLGYKSLAQMKQKRCWLCAQKTTAARIRVLDGTYAGASSTSHGIYVCTYCGTSVQRLSSHVPTSGRVFCSRAHASKWRSEEAVRRGTRVAITCRTCGVVQIFQGSEVPRTLDRDTMTWVCTSCRVPKTAWQERVCDHCQRLYRARIRLNKPGAAHFCSLACRYDHYKEVRRGRGPCAQCGGPIKRRGQASKYCSWACTKAAKQGRPNPHWRPSQAEQRVLEHWAAGVRGVRPLAAAAWVSKTTVQRLYKLGRLVESAAAARSA